MIISKVFTPVAGTTFFEAGEIAYVTIIKVCRDNKEFDATITTPGNREYLYSSYGRLDFEIPFSGNPANDVDREQLYVKYKY
jgi:hypothetical protein